MTKVALLIGVSEYEPGLKPLPAAQRDVQAVGEVLKHPEIGGFAEADIQQLVNPDPQQMRVAIELVFSGRNKDDLVLLYFSGHGIKDDRGKLYLATCSTRKTPAGELIRASAVEASFVQQVMSNSRSRRQVVILDCCFSGAFAEGLLAKDDSAVDIKIQLGGEGRVVLTSSTSTQYSFEQQGSDLSTYTRYLVEGIRTGAADRDSDGWISADELHEYTRAKVQQAAPAMKPEIYAVKEGYKILIAQAILDPMLVYRKEVEHFAHRGQISEIGRSTLEILRERLGLKLEVAAAIEAEVLKPYQEYEAKLKRYKQELDKAICRERFLSDNTREELKHFQQVLGLRDEDVKLIEAEVTSQLDVLYAQASHNFHNHQWARAIEIFSKIVAQQEDYEDATPKLEEARHQKQLAELYTEAERAYKEKSWAEAMKRLEAILALDPRYRDAPTKLEEAKCQKRLVDLYNEARRLHQTHQWKSVIAVFERIRTLNATYPDPDRLLVSAQQQLRERERRLATLYNEAVYYVNTIKWREALKPLEEILRIEPHYRDAEVLLVLVQKELVKPEIDIRPSIFLIAIGWLIAWFISSQPSNPFSFSAGNLAGYIGGFINGVAIWMTSQHKAVSVLWKQLLQILAFGFIGAFVGAIVWSITGSFFSGPFSEGSTFIQTFVGAAIGLGVLFWQLRQVRVKV